MNAKEIEGKLYSAFAGTASALGYSEVHGRIIGCLLVAGKPVSLSKLSKDTGYSLSMISLSLDLLEIIGAIKKIKRPKDRNLYVELTGDLLDGLKTAVLFKIEKGINSAMKDFEGYRAELQRLKGPDKERLMRSIDVLEKEMDRMGRYAHSLSNVEIPTK